MRWWPLLLASACATPSASTHARRVGTSELVLQCSVKDAEVTLDGVPQGTCDDFDGEPRGLKLGKGTRHVSVKKDGLVPWETWVETDGTRVVMVVNLMAAGGSP